MNRVFTILVVLAVLGGTALVYISTRSTKAVVLTPSQLATQDDRQDIERIRIGGTVTDDPITYTLEPEMVLSFRISDTESPGPHSIPVIYRGLKPDMFAPGRSVMIDGDYTNGTLVAAKLLTQCPSKYEPPTPKESTH